MKWISLETNHRVSLSWVSVASPTEAGLAGWEGELFVGGRADTQLPICSSLQWQPGLSYLPEAIMWVAGALGLHHGSQAIGQSPFLTLPSFLSSIESVPGGHRVKQAARETKARCRAGAGRRKCPSCRVQPGPGSSSRWAGWCGTWRKGRSSTGSAWVLPSTWPQSSSTWQVMWTHRSGNPSQVTLSLRPPLHPGWAGEPWFALYLSQGHCGGYWGFGLPDWLKLTPAGFREEDRGSTWREEKQRDFPRPPQERCVLLYTNVICKFLGSRRRQTTGKIGACYSFCRSFSLLLQGPHFSTPAVLNSMSINNGLSVHK